MATDSEQRAIDAARYRFIRDHFTKSWDIKMDGQHGWMFMRGWLAQFMKGDTFDIAIDNAMLAHETYAQKNPRPA